jgi:hypothetical protein
MHIGEGKDGLVDSGCWRGSRWRATSREHHQHRAALVGALGSAEEDLKHHDMCVPAAMAGLGARAVAMGDGRRGIERYK